jgi:hypothetical protein
MIAKFALGLVVIFASAYPVEVFAQAGRPAAASDFSGKTICWSDGLKAVYAANGQFTNNKGAHTVWSVTPGVLHVGSAVRQTDVLPDGRLHILLTGSHGHQNEYWGTACN